MAEDLLDAFRLFDTDGNGTISSEEWVNAMKLQGMPKEDALEVFNQFKNSSGEMVYDEFCKAFADIPDTARSNLDSARSNLDSVMNIDSSRSQVGAPPGKDLPGAT